MRIALASYEFKNKDVAFNLRQMERALKAVRGKAELLCFGEAFLQGFDALCWDHKIDLEIALEQNSEPIRSACALSEQYGVDLGFGYIERAGEDLYSSYALIENGRPAHNYRRVSRGWKEYWRTDAHYREGDTVEGFLYRGETVQLALCGDMWDYPERFRTNGLLLWPVYVNFSAEEWKANEADYAAQAALAADRVLLVDSLCRETEPDGVGGAFYFRGGRTVEKLPFGDEGILLVTL